MPQAKTLQTHAAWPTLASAPIRLSGPLPVIGLAGCSSHSGRRTFITRAARKITEAGGSLRDVQQLAGHASLAMTQRYIEGDSDAKRKLIALI
jgi:integrase